MSYTDTECHVCGARYGVHTLDALFEHVGEPFLDLPYEANPDGPVMVDESGTPIADTITVRPGRADEWPATITGLIFDFSIGHPDRPPTPVASILFVSSAEIMQRVGSLVRNGARHSASLVRSARDN